MRPDKPIDKRLAEPIVEYLNVYPKEFSAGHKTLGAAQAIQYPDKLAIIKVSFDKYRKTVTAEIVK